MGQIFTWIFSVTGVRPRQQLVTRTLGTQTGQQLVTRTLGTQAGQQLVTRTLGTQTTTKFTERLTNFDTDELSSTETFDHGCNICDMYKEKEAVGYCCNCKQYLCYNCCKHHEIISVCENHKIVGKEQFNSMNAVNSLFDMQMVPLLRTQLPLCTKLNCGSSCSHNRDLLASFSFDDFKYVYFLIHSEYNYYNKEVSTNSLEVLKVTQDAKHLHIISVIKHNDKENKICKYFVRKKSKDIWRLKYCDSTVSFEQVFTVSGECYGVAPFDNGLAISVYILTGFSLPDWQIQFLDFKGDIKRQIYYDAYGNPLFKYPGDIASNFTQDILFVSDELTNAVIALDTKGNVLYKFTHDTIKSPQAIACDEENNVYVACNNKVIQIHALGKKSRIILDSENKNIVNIYYYKENRRLAVIVESKDVTIFTFLQN